MKSKKSSLKVVKEKKYQLDVNVTTMDEGENKDNYILLQFLKSLERGDDPVFIPSPEFLNKALGIKKSERFFDYNDKDELKLTKKGELLLAHVKLITATVKKL